MHDPLYDVARQVTDEVMGPGTYARLNRDNPNPGVQAAIKRGRVEDFTGGEDLDLREHVDDDAPPTHCLTCTIPLPEGTPRETGFCNSECERNYDRA